ncbi:MAG: hypothetical protein K0R57_1329 [Paenibacillaceae bacterium]|jgi:AraC-like DNA-binding protein|nr:hypothetical protein [Paenibacillaceae bacterium]
MRVLQAYKSRKYLQRIMLSITFLMVAVLSLSSIVLHYSAEQRVLHIQQEANRKVMNQINHNMVYMQEIVKNQALQLYDSSEIVPLMTDKEAEPFDTISGIRQLNKALDSSSFLHSIMIYNARAGEIYAVGEIAAEKPGHALAVKLSELVQEEQKLPQMRLLPMNVSGQEHSVDFFSVMIYETYDESSRDDSVLILNIRPEWIFDNMKAVNDFAAPEQSSLFMIDNTGQVIISGNPHPTPSFAQLQTVMEKQRSENRDSFGFFTPEFAGLGKHIVTYMNMGAGEWQVVSVQPYKSVIGDIYKMRTTSVGVILIFLLLSVIVSVLLAHKLYKPVQTMLMRVKSQVEPGTDLPRGQDELSLVTDIHSELVHRLYRANNERDKQKEIVRNYYSRSIVTNSLSIAEEEFRECIAHNGLSIAPEGPFLLVIVKVDNQREFISQTSHTQRMLYLFAVSNIAEEIFKHHGYNCEIVDMRGEHLVVILSGGPMAVEEWRQDKLYTGMREIQDVIQQYYKLSVTMTTSGIFTGYREMTALYSTVLQHSMYKLLFGNKAVITPDMVRSNEEQLEYHLPPELEKRLIEAIRTNDPTVMGSSIKQMLNYFSGFHYDHIIHGMLHLVDIIKSTIREINSLRICAIPVDLGSLSRQVLEQETLAEMEQHLQSFCREIHEKLKNTDEAKNLALVQAVKEIIVANYQDLNLSLQSIAATLKMTPAYVGRIFKQLEFVSVGEYINEVRLNRAKEFLETKNLSIKEIMELAGFLNESTFFKLFKKKFGVTPKEYRLKRSMGQG